jgi:hypothetical protein
MLATVRCDEDTQAADTLIDAWHPLIVVIAHPGSLSRTERKRLLGKLLLNHEGSSTDNKPYHRRNVKCSHTELGGVTTSVWHFVHLVRSSHPELSQEAIMMTPEFSRSLQTALQDTVGELKGRTVEFEEARTARPLTGTHVVGNASIRRVMKPRPVYDALALAPDVGQLPREDRTIWVRANSVFGRKSKAGWKEKVVRPVVP